ncbi:hypothetical protein IQ250_16185 [Pseudanabaenaceae cyanobacterium LEGE 13415]|nr:hypothetical protein [Pseudanabaenaceae cyanobacterium LEGE 13415]
MPVDSLRTISELDRFAWNAICNWSKHTCAITSYNGIDYAELTRCFLWDKVARAIRKQTDPNRFELEQSILASRTVPTLRKPHPNRLKFWLKRSLKSFQTWRDVQALRSRSFLYVPHAHPTLCTIVEALTRSIKVVAPEKSFDAISGLHWIRSPLGSDAPNLAQVDAIHRGIVEGLQAFEIELLPQDAIVLRCQIAQLLLRTKQIHTELSMLRPAAILLFADNHFPVQSYVFSARQLGIKTIMLQHGLDCEHYCLDEAYADVISVWGISRFQRYQAQSNRQPEQIHVNGNPDYDRFCLPTKLDCSGEYWLWATRPHRPEKCYSPSRHPQEGVQILEAILAALARSPHARLVIKPHPLDDVALYQTCLERSPFRDRVTVSTESVRSLFPKATIVISEDSTIGLEAMFFGKPVIHAHFAESQPVLPFVDYDAALPAFSSEMLQTALQTVEHLSEAEQAKLFAGQQRFIQAFAGQCDRQAQTRIIAMIQDLLPD